MKIKSTQIKNILEDLFHYEGLKFLPIFTILPLICRDTKLPCFSWCMLKKPSGGAIATIGSTRVAFGFADNNGVHYGSSYLNLGFFKSYEPGILVSQMFTKAQNDYIDYIGKDYITLEQFNLLGDPSLKVGGYP